MSSFIPGLHFRPASKKLTKEWCAEIIDFYWSNNKLINLADGKNVEEIEGYTNGTYPMGPFKKMFKSLRKQAEQENNANIRKEDYNRMDQTAINWDRVALIQPKLNSAVATLQKRPIEVTATCIDPLAQKKKKEDLDFLRNKQKMIDFLQPLYDSMNLGDVELGATKHSSVPFTGMPMDLDVDNEEEFRLFADLIYNLAPESSFETILQSYYEFKKVQQVKLLETRDHYKFGVSVHDAIADKMTGLPDIEYVYPANVYTDGSLLPDYSDNIIRAIPEMITPIELLMKFPDDIKNKEQLEKIVNGEGKKGEWGTGYCNCNGKGRIKSGDWNNFKMSIVKIQVKSVDSVSVAQNGSYKYFTDNENNPDIKEKIWGQNTYTFYWLRNTKHFFGIDRLGFAYRTKGCENYQSFSTNIYKSQEKSAVEHCIGENKKAQMADVKLQHHIIMSLPPGKFIDIKYIRNAIDGLKDEGGEFTMQAILQAGREHNVFIIDSEGYENKQVGQTLPVKDLPGGLGNEILGYYKVRAEANHNISEYLSVNDQLTGQSATPEGLVGLQKLLVSAAINGLSYVDDAITTQYQSLFNIWAYYIQEIIKKGGAAKNAVTNIIGSRKVDIIKRLDEIPIHQMAIKISLGQREEERAMFRNEMMKMRDAGILNSADVYMISNTSNPKDAVWMLAVKETKWKKKQEEMQIRQNETMKEVQQIQGQNMLAQTQAATEGKVQAISAQTEGDAKLLQLSNQLGLTSEQYKTLAKRVLQNERIDKQTEKAVRTIYANQDAKSQSTGT